MSAILASWAVSATIWMLKREEGKECCEVGEREGEKEERRERKEREEKGQGGKESITTCCRYISS